METVSGVATEWKSLRKAVKVAKKILVFICKTNAGDHKEKIQTLIYANNAYNGQFSAILPALILELLT